VSIELTPQNSIEYNKLVSIIERARENAFHAVNRELISMYLDIGQYISRKVKNGGWGKSVVAHFSKFMQIEHPDIKGFSAQNIWRMKQFYETYYEKENLSALLREFRELAERFK